MVVNRKRERGKTRNSRYFHSLAMVSLDLNISTYYIYIPEVCILSVALGRITQSEVVDPLWQFSDQFQPSTSHITIQFVCEWQLYVVTINVILVNAPCRRNCLTFFLSSGQLRLQFSC